MGAFLSVQALHAEGLTKKAIARRLGLDVRTVRKYVRRIEAGAKQPERAAVPSKLDPFGETIEAKVEQGLSAVQIHDDLRREHPDFDASYESVKLKVRLLRRTEPKVYCRMRYRQKHAQPNQTSERSRVQLWSSANTPQLATSFH